MSRKDTILIAVVINAGLLAILFITAVIYDQEATDSPSELSLPLIDNRAAASQENVFSQSPVATPQEKSLEKKNESALKFYAMPADEVEVIPSISEEILYPSNEAAPQQKIVKKEDEIKNQSHPQTAPQEPSQVIVKKGDVLEKIAKANKVSVSALKKANKLESEKLSVGQVLKIPQNMTDSASQAPKSASVAAKPLQPSPTETKVEVPVSKKEEEPLYYVVLSGDNPWKIARQFGVKYDEILKLNNLDEEKARNLKIGDRIRIK